MATGTPPPLSVDPEQLSAAGGALHSSAEELPEAPAPFMPVGTDPLSVAIIGQIPAVETPVMTQLPLIQTQSIGTAQNVMDSARAYAATDARSGAAITQQMQNLPNAAGGSGSPAAAAGGGADSMGQMMGMPMQVAGQMAQMPMQVMGAVAAVPQGVMQGVQQAGQQVQQMVGQFGQGGTGNQDGGTEGGAPSAAGLPEDQRSDGPVPERDEPRQEDGAASGRPGEERAPEPKEPAGDTSSPATPPGRHRAAEPDDGINL